MGWLQFLNDVETPLERRLHGARMAFLNHSSQLTTQQKEDVVIQWLTRLVKEKQDSSWRSNACAEQESVWRLIAAIFSSRRIQALTQHHWTCPITSAFPQSIIDVLGSAAKVSTKTQHYIVTTVQYILSTPSLAPIITNSSSLSLHHATALLDLAANLPWEELEQKKKEASQSNGDNHSIIKKRRVDDGNEDVSETTFESMKNMSHEVQLLHCLTLLLDVVKQQMLARNDEAITLFSSQLLKRIANVRVTIDPYTGSIKNGLHNQLDSLFRTTLLNSKVFPRYELFLDHLQVEDSKVFNEQSAVHIVLSSLLDVIANESVPVLKYVLTQFYAGFVEQSTKENHRLLMLATLFYLVDVTVPGDFTIDPNNMAISFVEKVKVKSVRREAAVDCLVSVINRAKVSLRGPLFEDYFRSFLSYRKDNKPKTEHGYHTIQIILYMYPVQFSEIFPKIMGKLIVWEKSNDEIYKAYENLLLGLLNRFIRIQRLSQFLSMMLQSAVESKDSLKSHKNFLPLSENNAKLKLNGSAVIFPATFLNLLANTVRTSEPILLVNILRDLIEQWQTVALPLLQEGGESCSRAACVCGWLLSSVLWGVCPQSVVRVAGFSSQLSEILETILTKIIRPTLEFLLATEHDNASISGMLMVCRAWSHLMHQLMRSNTRAMQEWTNTDNGESDGLVLHTSNKTWQQLQNRINELGDKHAKTELILLCMQRLSQLRELHVRQLVQEKTKTTKNEKHSLKNDKDLENGDIVEVKASGKLKLTITVISEQLLMLVSHCVDETDILVAQQLPALQYVLQDTKELKLLAKATITGYTSGCAEWKKSLGGYRQLELLYPHLATCAIEHLVCNFEKTDGDDHVMYNPPVVTHKKRKRKDQKQSDENELLKEEKYSIFTLLDEISLDIEKYRIGTTKHTRHLFITKLNKYCVILNQFTSLENINQPIVSYKFADECEKVLHLLLDVPLNKLREEQLSLLTISLLTLVIYCDDMQRPEADATSRLLIGALNTCLSCSPVARLVPAALDLHSVLCRLLVLLQRVPTDEQNGNNKRASFATQLQCTVRLLARHLLAHTEEPSQLVCVTDDIVRHAKQAYTQGGAKEEETYLSQAWLLVLVASQCLHNGISASREEVASKCIRSLGSWSVRVLHRLDLSTTTPDVALYILSIYTALIKVEMRRSGVKMVSTIAPSSDTTVSGDTPLGWQEANTTITGQLSVDDGSLNTTLEASDGGKAKRWLRYLEEGVELAKMCFGGAFPKLSAAGMSFIIATKLLPVSVQQKLPSDMFKVALNYFTKEPSNYNMYLKVHKECDAEELPEVSSVQPDNMTDPVSMKPISLSTFLADCPQEMYSALLQSLLKRSLNLDSGLFTYTATIWNIIINTKVPFEQMKAKRSALNVLSRSLVWLLSAPATATDKDVLLQGHKASVMCLLLELLCTILGGSDQLSPQTVMLAIPAATTSTRHLSLQHFVKVWRCQVALLEACLLTRLECWQSRVAGLLAAVQQTVAELVWRARQTSPLALQNKEALTGCCLCLERLLRQLPQLKDQVQYMVHMTLAAIITELHTTTVIAPVKKVLDQQVYQLFRLCHNKTLEHLMVSLPLETRPLVQHYHHNYTKYYAFDSKKE